jgi:hypothetical protein
VKKLRASANQPKGNFDAPHANVKTHDAAEEDLEELMNF